MNLSTKEDTTCRSCITKITSPKGDQLIKTNMKDIISLQRGNHLCRTTHYDRGFTQRKQNNLMSHSRFGPTLIEYYIPDLTALK